MKKLALVLVAMLTMVFTGCKTETSTITVYVEDDMGLPVAQRPVFYADYASLIIGAVLPSPEELAYDTNDAWEYATTNALGIAKVQISLSVSKLKYKFMVWDEGTRGWKDKTVELRRGINEEIDLKVLN